MIYKYCLDNNAIFAEDAYHVFVYSYNKYTLDEWKEIITKAYKAIGEADPSFKHDVDIDTVKRYLVKNDERFFEIQTVAVAYVGPDTKKGDYHYKIRGFREVNEDNFW